MSAGRLIVVPWWVMAPFVASSLLGIAEPWLPPKARERQRIAECQAQAASVRRVADTCGDQLVSCLGYSRAIVDRLDRIAGEGGF